MTDQTRFPMSIFGLISEEDVVAANRLNNSDEIFALARPHMERKADELGMEKTGRYFFVDSDLFTRKWIVHLLGWRPEEHQLAVFEIDFSELLESKENNP